MKKHRRALSWCKDDKIGYSSCLTQLMDLLPNEQNFDLDKSRQTFYYDLKEHHNYTNIPKFRCEML